MSYRDGRTSPTIDLLMKICEEFSINPAWLLLGDAPVRPGETGGAAPFVSPLDLELLRQVLAGIDRGLADRRLTLAPDKKADLVALLYDHYAKTGESPEDQTVERYLRLVA